MLEWTFETPTQVGMYLKKYLPTMKTTEMLVFVRKVEDSSGPRLEWSRNGDDWRELEKEEDCVWVGPLQIKNHLIDYDNVLVKHGRTYLTSDNSKVSIIKANIGKFTGDNHIVYGVTGIPLGNGLSQHRLIKELKNGK